MGLRELREARGLRRGGVLAGAAALLAGALAKAAERVARAADGEPLLVGQTNTATSTTVLARSSVPISPTVEALRVTNDRGAGVLGISPTATGVHGVGQTGVAGDGAATGVVGSSLVGTGVVGVSPLGTGVAGRSPSTGVLGDSSAGGTGVRGTGGFGTGVVGTGAVGVRGDGGAAGIGVAGSAAGGAGVVGTSATGTGVSGESPAGAGVFGASATGTGVWATCPEGIALYAASAAYLAGRFDGQVEVNGPLVVRGDLHVVGAPAAAAAAPDGSLRRLYALASPEGWVEDFGEGQLAGGAAQVRLDPELAALTRGDAYQVFLTAYGDTPGLYVGARGPGAFEVRERPGGTGGTAFGYRVVAKRRDAAGPRLERLERVPPRPPRLAPVAPAVPRLPELPPLPEPPSLPEVPRGPGVPPGQRRDG